MSIFAREGNTHNIALKIAMSCHATVLRLQSILKIGTINTEARGKNKDIHGWAIKGINVGIVLKKLLPYIFTKRRQAQVAIEYCDECLVPTPKGGSKFGVRIPVEIQALRELLFDEMKKLNKTGK